MANNSLFCASLVTQSVALAVFLYEGFAYNMVYLRRILPAVGKAPLIPPFAVLFNTVWGLAMWSYMKAHWVDPGTVPKRWQDWVRSMGEALPVAPARPEWQPGKATYCKKCDVPRPERAHHCLICEVCVLRMDHHCPWLNNCVGFNNHKFFFLLGIYACLASLVGLATALPELWYCAAATARLEDGLTFGEHGDVGASDTLVFLIFGLLALFAAFLLAPMLLTHVPLAAQNCTTIEDNYENMPNPFDQGTTASNLAQVFGSYGPDWLLPVAPWKPLSDGVSFARSDERLGPDGLPERSGVGGNGEDVEELWRIRYQVRSPQTVASDNGPLVSLARWWTGEC